MARARDRKSAAGLLPRMEARPWADGKTVSYRYHPVGGKPVALGTDKTAAIRRVLDMNGESLTYGTLTWVWERFTDERTPAPRWKKMGKGTQDDYRLAWKQIAKTFGRTPAGAITSTMVARYVHEERASSPRRADIEKTLMSNLFKHGIRLGVCSVNATIGVEPHGSQARTVAPKDDVLASFLSWLEKQTPQRRVIAAAAEFASLAGSRQIEFRELSWPQVDEKAGVIRLRRAKQRGRMEVIDVIEITPRLAAFLGKLRELHATRSKKRAECLSVFPTRGGNAYSTSGFRTLWQRSVTAAIKAGVIKAEDRFTFHDLRAYYTSAHKRERGGLPDLHKDPGTTARIYDRNKEVKRSAL